MFGLSGMLFILLLSIAAFAFLFENVSSSLDYRDMQARSYYASMQILSRGDPPAWASLNSSQINNYGLVREAGVLDQAKIGALSSEILSNYSLVAARLGISKYNYSIQIIDFYNGSILYSMGYANSSRVISQSEMSYLNGSFVLVQLKVAK